MALFRRYGTIFCAVPRFLNVKKEYLEFITYCVGSLADSLQISASKVFEALRSTNTLSGYIVPCYDVLHTFGKEYLVDELTAVLKERGASL